MQCRLPELKFDFLLKIATHSQISPAHTDQNANPVTIINNCVKI